MRARFLTWTLAFAASAVAANGGAMTAPNTRPNNHCSVVGDEKLPSDTGGASAICDAVERAVAARAPSLRYSAEINVVSRSRLTATLIVNGRALPEQRFAVMDRNLSATSIQHFADAIAAEIAKSVKA